MTSPNCVIRVPAKDTYSTDGETLMGRQSANEGFLSAWFRHTNFAEYWCMARFRGEAEVFARLGHRVRESSGAEKPVCRWIRQAQIHRSRMVGTVYLPGPQVADMAWVRRRDPSARASDFSLVGITHTSCELGIQDGLADMLTAPVYEWDAQICPSQSVQTMVKRLLDDEASWLREHLGATRIERPQLPVIPLGIDSSRFQIGETERVHLRSQWRQRWQVAHDEICVLYVGRLDFRTKANLFPTLDALELAAQRLKARSGPRLVLALSGWFASEWDEQVLRDAITEACPSVRVVIEDGRSGEARRAVWQAADIFTSLVDNVQETFGLTPIEAMAAGLPVVVSDYDGYRESVRQGIDGFRIPTLQPPAGTGTDLIDLHSDQAIGYREYVGRASALIGIDISAAAHAFVSLAHDPSLRSVMGAAGSRRARENYEWQVLVPRIQQLFVELETIRREASERHSRTSVTPANPRRRDPFYSFSHYPSEASGPSCRIHPGPLLPRDAGAQRRAIERHLSRPVYQSLKAELDLDELEQILQAVTRCPDGIRLSDLAGNVAERQATLVRCAGWLLKSGLVSIRSDRVDACGSA